MEPFVSATCEGERCHCGKPAAKKVGEEIPFDDPVPARHNLTAYVCADHYAELMGPVGAKQVSSSIPTPEASEQDALREARNVLDRLLDYALVHNCGGLVENADEGKQSPLVTDAKHAIEKLDRALTASPKGQPSIFDLLEPLSKALLDNGGPDIRGGFARKTGGVDLPWIIQQLSKGHSEASVDELCAKLRRTFQRGPCSGDLPINPNGPEAADALEAQALHIAELREALEEATDQLWHLAKDGDENYLVKRCRTALSNSVSRKQTKDN
jgi:hypothetical protein